MPIQIGSRLPEQDLMRWVGTQMTRVPITSLVNEGRTLIVGVVGAFTPACSESHLKDYLPIVPALRKDARVDRFICIAVVDPFVMYAWGQEMGAGEHFEMWADPYADFAKAIDVTSDFTEVGLGIRSGRYSMLVRDGVVETVNIESDPNIVTVSGAGEMYARLLAS